MPRIAPEKIYTSWHPSARIECQKSGYGKPYYLVRRWDNGQPRQDWSGYGDTRAKAWADACDRANLKTLRVDAKQCCPRDHDLDGNCDRHPANEGPTT